MGNTIFREVREQQPKLLIVRNEHIEEYIIPQFAVIGRDNPDYLVDLDLVEDFVSRQQAEIGYDVYGYYYKDKTSTNGSYYNGGRLAPECKQYLKNGDVIHIFHASEHRFVALVFVTDYPDTFSSGTILLTDDMAEINIGRGSSSNVSVMDNTVSFNHASFFVAKNGWAVYDCQSKNGVYLNNQRIFPAKYLQIGDCIWRQCWVAIMSNEYWRTTLT